MTSRRDDLIVVPDLKKPGMKLGNAQPLTDRDIHEARTSRGHIPPIVLQLPGFAASPGQFAQSQFDDAIRRGSLRPDEAGSAKDILEDVRRRQNAPTAQVAAAMERQLTVALEDRGQQAMNRYIEGDQIPQEKSDFDECARDFDEALKIDPGNSFDRSRQLFCSGRTLIFLGNYAAAEQRLLESVQLDPKRAYSYNALGIAHLEQIHASTGSGEAVQAFDTAAGYFRQAMRYAAYWPYPIHNLALTMIERGDFDGAIRMYELAMKIAPQYSYLPYNLALLYERLGDLDKVQHWFEEADRTALRYPRKRDNVWFDRAQVKNGLGAIARERGRSGKAEEYFNSALTLDPKNKNARQNLALLLAAKHDFGGADRLWKANIEDDHTFLVSRISFADSLRSRGESAAAIQQYLEAFASLTPPADNPTLTRQSNGAIWFSLMP
jgi:tetratricopeptide (TPR) repeat protein